MAESVTIELTKDQAIVLFEFVSRFTDDDLLMIEDPAEQAALWWLCADLEKILVEPFRSNYGEILERARQTLRDAAFDFPPNP